MCEYCDGSEVKLMRYTNANSMKVEFGQYSGIRTESFLRMRGNVLLLDGSAKYRSSFDCYYEANGLDCEGKKSIDVDSSYMRIEYCPFCGRKIESVEYEQMDLSDRIKGKKSELERLRCEYEESGLFIQIEWEQFLKADEESAYMTLCELESLFPTKCEVYTSYNGYKNVDNIEWFDIDDRIKYASYSRPMSYSNIYRLDKETYERLCGLGFVKCDGSMLRESVNKRKELREKINGVEKELFELETSLEALGVKKKIKNRKVMMKKEGMVTPALFEEWYGNPSVFFEGEVLDLSGCLYNPEMTIMDLVGGLAKRHTIRNVVFPVGMNFCLCYSRNKDYIVYFNNCRFKENRFSYSVIQNIKFVDCQFEETWMCNVVLSTVVFNNTVFNSGGLEFVTFCPNCSIYNSTFDFENIIEVVGFNNLCPSDGSFIGWKAGMLYDDNGAKSVLVKLEIPDGARRSSGFGRKCRADKAKVLGFYEEEGNELSSDIEVQSLYNPGFKYRVGEIVMEPDFDENPFNTCSYGIHFYVTRDEALHLVHTHNVIEKQINLKIV